MAVRGTNRSVLRLCEVFLFMTIAVGIIVQPERKTKKDNRKIPEP